MTRDKAVNSSRGASIFVALGILLSRISGLVRARVMAHFLGNSPAAGAFMAALRIPNFLQNLFGEGILSASFIPVYARLRAENDGESARKVAGVVGSVLALATSILVVIGVTFTPLFVDLVAPGFSGETRDLTVQIVRILFPGVGLLVLSAWCLGILNSHRQFFISYSAPVLWNAAMIVALVAFGRTQSESNLAVTLAWGALVGSGLQFAVQLPFVFHFAGQLRPQLDLAFQPVRRVFHQLGPVLISRGVVQLSAYIDAMIASYLGPTAVACLGNAQILYLLPISLFGMSVAAAELPEMSATSQDNDEARAKLRARLAQGRRYIGYFVIPTAVAFVFLGRYIVQALFQTGHFSSEDTTYVWYVLMGSVVGLLAATWGRLYSSAFYALGDTRTPLKFAMVRVALTLVLGIVFAFPARPLFLAFLNALGLDIPRVADFSLGVGAMGLTSSQGFAAWIEFLLLRGALGKRIGAVHLAREFIVKIWLASFIAMGVAFLGGYGLRLIVTNEISVFHYNCFPLLVLGIFAAVFVLLTIGFGVDESRRVTSFVNSLAKKARLK